MTELEKLESLVVRETCAEAEHDAVGVIVGERSQAVEFFLSGCVPQ